MASLKGDSHTMRRKAIPSLVSAGMIAGLWTAIPSTGRAESLANTHTSNTDQREELVATVTEGAGDLPTSDRLIAQLFYPPVSNPRALRVPGRGQASEPANTASLVFKFSSNSSLDSQEGTVSYSKLVQEALSKESLKPVVDALVAIGVPTDAIQVKILKPRPSALPFPFPSTGAEGGAEVRVTINQPTRDRLEQIVTTVSQSASKNKDYSISSVSVEYFAKDCPALERAAYQAAVEDAQNRASVIAQAMGAKLSRVGSVAEPFYNVYIPACNSGGSLPFGGDATSPYDPNEPVEVEVTKEMFFTFPID